MVLRTCVVFTFRKAVDTSLCYELLCSKVANGVTKYVVKAVKPHSIITADDETHHFDWVFDARGVGARRLKHPHPTAIFL